MSAHEDEKGQPEPTTVSHLSPETIASARQGRLVFICSTIFAVGFPVFVCCSASRHVGFVTCVGAALAFLAVLTTIGANWARIGMTVLSAVMSGVLLFSVFNILATHQTGTNGALLNLIPLIFIPGVGYAFCAFLFCSPEVALWQSEIRRVTFERMLANQQRERALKSAAVLEPCPWCEAIAVDPYDQYCRSCKRPSG